MPVVLAHHHILGNIIKAIMSIYEDFASAIVIDSFTTPFLHNNPLNVSVAFM